MYYNNTVRILEVIASVKGRLSRNRRFLLGLVLAIIISYIALFYLVLLQISPLLALSVSLVVFLSAMAFLWIRGDFKAVEQVEAGSFLDEQFSTKGRVLSYLHLNQDEISQADTGEKELLEIQLKKRIPEFEVSDLIPLKIPKPIRLFSFSLPLVWFLILFFGFSLGSNSGTVASKEASLVRELLAEQPELPEAVQEELENLAEALESSALSDEEVGEALERAEQEIENAQQELDAENIESVEGVKTDQADELTPTPTPTPQPQEQEQPQEEEQKSEEEKSEDSEKQESSSEEQEQSKDGKDEEGDGDGEGDNGESQKQGEKEGDSEGGEAGEKGEQDSKSESEAQQGEQSEDSEAEGESGNQSQGEPSDSEGEQGQQDALSQAQKMVSELKEQQEQSSEQQDSQSMNEAKEQGENEQTGEQSEKGPEEEQQEGQSGEKGEPQEGEKKEEAKPGEKGEGSENNSAPPEEQAENADQAKPGESSKEQSEPSEDEQEEARPAQPTNSDAADRFGDEAGGLGEEERDSIKFEEQEIKSADEELDPKFLGEDGEIAKNSSEAKLKTKISEVKLAKPEPVQAKRRQEVPLEYKELFE